MRKLIFVITTFLALAASAFAQDKAKDSIILTVGVGADEISDLLDTQYNYAVKVAANAKIAGDNARLGGKFVFDKTDGSKRYSAGPEFSYKIRFVEPYAHFLIGAETLDGIEGRAFIRTVGAGVRLNYGHVVINPLQIDSTRGLRAPFLSQGVTQFSASVGVRF